MLENTANIVLAILGIGFLIFMHELGHFLAARLFKVRVETFSLGFGPRLAGWRHGDTDYRISALPLGGYVKMAGEYGELDDDEPLRDDDLTAKPIWQRFVIFSGGVVVNFLLAFLIFPLAFGMGVPFVTNELGSVAPGGPGWDAGLRSGDVVLAVNGAKIYGFNDIALEVALSDPDDTTLLIERDGREQLVRVTPQQRDDRYDIEVAPATVDTLAVDEGTPAWRAGVRPGDRLVSVGELVVGATRRGERITPGAALASASPSGAPLPLVVERGDERLELSITPEMVPIPGSARVLGAWPLSTRLGALRGEALDPSFPLRSGDALRRVGEVAVYDAEAAWELLEQQPAGAVVALTIDRDGRERQVSLDATQRGLLLSGDVAWSQDMQTNLIRVMPGGALQDAGLRTGDRLLAIDDRALDDYAALLERMGQAEDDGQVEFLVAFERDGSERSVAVRTRPREAADYGLALLNAQVRHELDLAGALSAGWDASVNALRTTGLTLTKLVTGEVGAKNLGGPLSISYITYKQAQWDFAKLLFFLALLSVNLGFINVLPIPVLDGGQILFLLCEKVKGSRLSEAFLQNAQLAGFVAILALMAYVTYNDILRFWQ